VLSGLDVKLDQTRKKDHKSRYVLENERVKVGEFFDGRPGHEFEVLLLNLTSLGVLVAEDEMHLS
jgi:hypothetical protein